MILDSPQEGQGSALHPPSAQRAFLCRAALLRIQGPYGPWQGPGAAPHRH